MNDIKLTIKEIDFLRNILKMQVKIADIKQEKHVIQTILLRKLYLLKKAQGGCLYEG